MKTLELPERRWEELKRFLAFYESVSRSTLSEQYTIDSNLEAVADLQLVIYLQRRMELCATS
jgi:hypothetical protein